MEILSCVGLEVYRNCSKYAGKYFWKRCENQVVVATDFAVETVWRTAGVAFEAGRCIAGMARRDSIFLTGSIKNNTCLIDSRVMWEVTLAAFLLVSAMMKGEAR
ncbi:hypothetical protein [Burkholderia metallica]|uniref:hypothetical protein n=1 Tax=Burkholderia metallica TaxID=488729 RepID=UPI00131D50CA|nr:hypothetical protein [Burkholderia metallica]